MADLPATAPDSSEVDEFDERLVAAREREDEIEELTRVGGVPIAWYPQAGSQTDFLDCPLFEVLYHGTRGPGKTDGLLMSYAKHVGQGYGEAWRGAIFRETYPQLADVVARSERWFPQIFPGARFTRSGAAGRGMSWQFPGGEVLMFRHMRTADDYRNYHGHQIPWLGFEELTNWSDAQCYLLMLSCCRSDNKHAPRMVRATTNPYGPGHQWVKMRWKLDGRWWETTVILPEAKDGELAERPRAAIFGHIDENRILLDADPHYKQNIVSAASNKEMAKAWLHGSWRIVAGGMFDDVFSFEHNDLPRFVVPKTWGIKRSFDWGSSHPFSVGWWAKSDGSDLRLGDGRVMSTVRGDLFRIKEWYGCTGKPNEGLRLTSVEVAQGIVERELMWGLRGDGWCRVSGGIADASIFKQEDGNCIAKNMAKPIRVRGVLWPGLTWAKSDKSGGSRVRGWEVMRTWIKEAQPKAGLPRENPGLFVVGEECEDWIRTVIGIPRDKRNMDDVDTDAEDHPADETRDFLVGQGKEGWSGQVVGVY